mgnify:CR=1 FL=1
MSRRGLRPFSFRLLVRTTQPQLSAFRELKGWDRRTKEIVRVAKLQWPIQQVDEVKAVLRELATAAGKRHELAHGVWGEIDGRNDVIALFPESAFTDISIRIVEAESVGTSQIDAKVQETLLRGCLVGVGDLESLREDVARARGLVHAYQLKLMPSKFDLTGQVFADQARKISEDPRVADRMLNAARSRRADEK